MGFRLRYILDRPVDYVDSSQSYRVSIRIPGIIHLRRSVASGKAAETCIL